MLSEEVINNLIKGKTPDEIVGEGGLLKQLQKQLVEAALKGEMTHHLGYEKNEKAGKGNSRNGYSKKTLKGDFGEMEIDIPRDRNGEFKPVIVEKGQTRFKGFDQKILSLYSRGMTTREIQAHLSEIYGVGISPALVSTVTNEVMDQVTQWQSRPLESVYPVVYLDALWVKIRTDKRIINRAVYLCLAINMEGRKELLGMWIGHNEGAAFWHGVVTDLANRGVKDIYVACVDGLKGFPEAIQAVFPHTQVQLCVVHMIRNSLRFVSYKDRTAVVAALKPIYTANTCEQAKAKLLDFAEAWDERYPAISASWNRHWNELTTFFAYPPDIRRILYTTNPLESLNAALRKVTKNRHVFSNESAVLKLFFLAATNASKKWTSPVNSWKLALASFTILYEDRLPY